MGARHAALMVVSPRGVEATATVHSNDWCQTFRLDDPRVYVRAQLLDEHGHMLALSNAVFLLPAQYQGISQHALRCLSGSTRMLEENKHFRKAEIHERHLRCATCPVFAAGGAGLPAATSPTPPRRRAHPVRWLAAGVAAVLLCGIAALAVAAQSSADPQLAAIQQVIQRGNDEQVQAISSQNPAVMSDTATPAHYQQLVQVNQNLLGQGVASIRLTNLTWGPITIDGTTATATSYETWVTTFADSTTMSSTDTNVYTLVQQNGSWVIQDDQQPTATPTASQPSTSPAAPGLPGQPSASAPAPQAVAPGAQNTSHNWSGYAATNGQPYTAVTGTWTVPQLASGGAQGVGATWVGIGGVTSHDLIQAGTQDVASGNGQSQYQAWIETLPQASRQVPLAVAPGDS